MDKRMKGRFIYQMIFQSHQRDERGVIFPFSLFLLFLFTLMTFHAAMKYETEKQFFQNISKTHEVETLLMAGYHDAKQLYQEGKLLESGQFLYDIGHVDYDVLNDKKQELLLYFQVFTNNGGRLYYEMKMKKDEDIANQSF
jgi:hypothetical protein